jgi:hypothetical protein
VTVVSATVKRTVMVLMTRILFRPIVAKSVKDPGKILRPLDCAGVLYSQPNDGGNTSQRVGHRFVTVD